VIEKMIVKLRKLDDTYMKGYVQPEAGAPPPSDYFLGFRSPGTQVRTISPIINRRILRGLLLNLLLFGF
jgi:hypothetical protein